MRASQSQIQTLYSMQGYQTSHRLLELYFVPESTYFEGPVNVRNKTYRHVRSAVTEDKITAHLKGEVNICAPSAHQGLSRWVCMDIDSHILGLVKKARLMLKDKGLPSYVSSSGEGGYHLTVFLERPVSLFKAQEISRELQRVAEAIKLPYCKISPSPYGSGGDCIKLPLGIHPEIGNYCCFLDDDLKPVEDLAFLESIQTVNVGRISSDKVNPNTGEIITEFPETISQRPCVNKLWREGIQASNTRHSATCVIANSLVRTRLISDKETAIIDWLLRTYPEAHSKYLVNSDMEYAIKETQRILHHYQQNGTHAELCENSVFKSAMRSACENEFECKLNQNHGHSNLELLLRLGVFNATNANPPGIGKSSMAIYLAIGLVVKDFANFYWRDTPAFSLSTQQLICMANCTKQTVIEHRKRLVNTGLLLKVPTKDIPHDVLHSTHPFFRNSFYALPDLTEDRVISVLDKLRSR